MPRMFALFFGLVYAVFKRRQASKSLIQGGFHSDAGTGGDRLDYTFVKACAIKIICEPECLVYSSVLNKE